VVDCPLPLGGRDARLGKILRVVLDLMECYHSGGAITAIRLRRKQHDDRSAVLTCGTRPLTLTHGYPYPFGRVGVLQGTGKGMTQPTHRLPFQGTRN
jgi:hypothetical protein